MESLKFWKIFFYSESDDICKVGEYRVIVKVRCVGKNKVCIFIS